MSFSDLRSQWLRARRAAPHGGEVERFVVAATFTAEPLIPYLGAKWIADGRPIPAIDIAPYDQIVQVCLNWRQLYADREPTAIIILWRIEDYLRSELLEAARGSADLSSALAKIDELRAAVMTLRNSFSGVLVTSLPPFPHGPDHDIRTARNAATVGRLHRRIVEEWVGSMDQPGIALLDLDSCQRLIGIEKSVDLRKWYLYRQPYSEELWHEAAEALHQILNRQRTAPKKCLVVDCDNTLWGGIIGEDGVQGISLGADFPGSAFQDFQRQLLTLRSKGVMLAICSKNNEDDVWEVFERHDAMLVRREDFVAHRINWLDKAMNIESIAAELNIGLDSLVFVDDSAIEIESVRSRLPMVTCLQVPAELARFPASINAYRSFDRDNVSAEDRSRSDMMLEQRKRAALAGSLSAEEFTNSLELSVDVFDVQAEHVARVAQLINKTNQFNLTTRRKTVAEVSALCRDPGIEVLAWRVSDRFGDYGLVGVVILQMAGTAIEIETFLMSCRVLGRGVESAIFAAIAEVARRRGAARIRGRYDASAKNSLVADLYRRHGFDLQTDGAWESSSLDDHRWPAHIAQRGLAGQSPA